MEDSKISLLPQASTIDGTKDLLVIVNENETRKITVNALFAEASALKGSLRLQGDWNATTNSPDILSISTIETGFAWRVSVEGNTNIGGITDWSLGDLAVKTDSGWIKIGSKDIGAVWGNITGNITDQNDLKSTFDSKLNKNTDIIGATKTKITYDEKGLVTFGADATTNDIPEGNNNLYYTDARVIAIGDDRYDTKGQLDSLHNLGLLQGNIEDLGKTWVKVDVDSAHASEFQAVYHVCSLGNGTILAGSYGGLDYGIKVFRSKDYGKTFPETFNVDSAPEHTTFQLLSLGDGIALCAAGYQDGCGNIYRSANYGETWTKIEVDVNIDSTFCFCDLGNGVVLCGTGGSDGEGLIWKSTNNGINWTAKTVDQNLTMIPSITYLGNDIVICASLNKLYKSVDAGNTWILLYSIESTDKINTTAYLGNGIIVFGTESGKLYRSVDNGLTWIVKSASTSIRFITYVGCGVTFYTSSGAAGAKQAKLFKSKNNGSTWDEIITPFSLQLDYAVRMCYVGNSLLLLGVGDATPGSAAVYRSCLIEPTITNSVTNATLNTEIVDRTAADTNLQQQINNISIPTFANGLTNNAGIVKLGGTLTEKTIIDGGSKDFYLGDTSKSLSNLHIDTVNLEFFVSGQTVPSVWINRDNFVLGRQDCTGPIVKTFAPRAYIFNNSANPIAQFNDNNKIILGIDSGADAMYRLDLTKNNVRLGKISDGTPFFEINNNAFLLNNGVLSYNGDLSANFNNYSLPHKKYVDDLINSISGQKGVANGVATLDSNGKVPSSQLPSFVDDVMEYSSLISFPTTGETSKIYIALDTNFIYRWSGSQYTEISSSIALGETSSTAYRGDRGKIAYDHSQLTGSNPHATTLEQVRAAGNSLAGDINDNQHKIVNIANPSNAQDAANKQWVETKQINSQFSIIGGGDLSANRTLQLVNDVVSPNNNSIYGANDTGARGWYNIPASIEAQFNLINGGLIQNYDDYLYLDNAQRSGNDGGLNSNAVIPFMIPVDCILVGAEFYIGYVAVGGTYVNGSVAVNFKVNVITQSGATSIATLSPSVTGTTNNIGNYGNFASNALGATVALSGLNVAFSAGQLIGLKFIHDTTTSAVIASSIKYVIAKLMFRPKI